MNIIYFAKTLKLFPFTPLRGSYNWKRKIKVKKRIKMSIFLYCVIWGCIVSYCMHLITRHSQYGHDTIYTTTIQPCMTWYISVFYLFFLWLSSHMIYSKTPWIVLDICICVCVPCNKYHFVTFKARISQVIFGKAVCLGKIFEKSWKIWKNKISKKLSKIIINEKLTWICKRTG